MAPQTLSNLLKGSTPGADKALSLADALGVNYRWLIAGEGPQRPHGPGVADDSVTLFRYDLAAIEQDGKDAAEELTFPRIFLSSLRSPTGTWLAYMPTDAMPSVAREGDLIICADPESPLQDRRIYVFNLDGNLIVRRVLVRPDGLVLKGEADDDTITIRPDETESLFPVARVLGPLGFNPA